MHMIGTVVEDRTVASARLPTAGAVLELLKPITWFPPMWAFTCGVVSSGVSLGERWPFLVGGVLLAGPLVCGTSQAVNDWFDRDVDAINEPHRVVPSGRMPGRWGLYVAIIASALSLAVSTVLGPWVVLATVLGLALAWVYSAPPLRLKRDGWIGPGTCGFAYEALPWFTAAAVAIGTFPGLPITLIAVLYGAGALGIMALNDFKSVEGDASSNVRTLPVRYGTKNAVLIACVVMVIPQLAVVALLVVWGQAIHAAFVATLIILQGGCMVRLVRDPLRFAPWYNAVGTGLYVTGMMVTAFALRAVS